MKAGLKRTEGFIPAPRHCVGGAESFDENDTESQTSSQNHTKKKHHDLSRGGFTLLELMVVALISVFVFIAFSSAMDLNLSLIESAENSIVALRDATSVMENIRNVNPIDSASLNAAYPDGGFVPGYNNLNQETIQVNYENLAADPIKVTVTVSWMEKTRARSDTLVTQLTQR